MTIVSSDFNRFLFMLAVIILTTVGTQHLLRDFSPNKLVVKESCFYRGPNPYVQYHTFTNVKPFIKEYRTYEIMLLQTYLVK